MRAWPSVFSGGGVRRGIETIGWLVRFGASARAWWPVAGRAAIGAVATGIAYEVVGRSEGGHVAIGPTTTLVAGVLLTLLCLAYGAAGQVRLARSQRMIDAQMLELRRANATLSTLVANLPIAVSLVGPDLRYKAFNEAFLTGYGLSPGQLRIGDCFETFIRYVAQRRTLGEIDVDADVRARIERARQQGREQYELTLSDGRIFDVTIVPLPGGGFATARVDVTRLRRRHMEAETARAQLEAQAAELQKANAALQDEVDRRIRAESLLRDAIESISDGFVLYDAHDRVALYNEKYRALRAYDPAIKPGQDFAEIVRSAIDRDEIKLPAAETEGWIDERIRQHRNPVGPLFMRIGERWIRVSERKTGEGGVVSILSDITDLKTAQAEADAARARMADWTEIASDWFWEADADGKLTFLSEGAHVRSGVPVGERIGRQRIDMPQDADLGDPRWRAHLDTIARREPFRNFVVETHLDKVRHVSLSGRPIFDPTGTFLGYRGTSRDVTAEVEAERELARQTAILSSVVENLPWGIGLLDRDLRLMAFNQPFLELRGLPADLAHVGVSWEELLRHAIAQGEFGPGDPEAILRERMTIAMVRQRMQFERVRPNGQVIDVSHIPLPDGGCIAVFIDVTDKRRMERQLADSQKMEAVGRLTGGLAHDFNNLLGIVIGNLDHQIDLLKHRPDTSAVAAEVQDLAVDALDAALRGADVVRHLVAFSRGQPLQPKRVDAGSVIRDIVPLLHRSLGGGVALEIAGCDQAWPVMADPAHLENAILNLVLNARDAMPQGGRLTIASGRAVLDDRGAAALELSRGAYVTITVRDTGTGIAPEILPRVFEPFFTTKEVGKGSGLGLSTVYGYARQSGGTVRIASELGRGTDVHIYLPLARDAGAAPRDKADRRTVSRTGDERILVVEDNDEVRQMALRLLNDFGYGTLEAENAAVALALADRGAQFDLLFTDVVMPGAMDGIELARELRRRRPQMPIVLATGVSSRDGMVDAAASLRAAIIAKPYRKADVAASVRTALDRAVADASASAEA